MDGFLTALAITFWVGVIVSNGVYRSRAGLGFWSGRLRILGPTGVGVEWLVMTMAKMLAWPIVLGVWLATRSPRTAHPVQRKGPRPTAGKRSGPASSCVIATPRRTI